jgi:hypothetical protein
MAENSNRPGPREAAPGREFHAVADLFPLLEGPAFEELVADIKRNGLREPILLDAEGRIVDGRNRYRACLAAGVEPRFVEWQGEGSLAELALSLNLRRRHLNESQRAMVAARLAKMMEQEAAQRKGKRTDLVANLRPGQRRRSSTEAAAQVNVSPRLVSCALQALRTGCFELLAAVESGALAVSTAAVLAQLPEPEQKSLVTAGPKEIARQVRELRGAKKESRPRPAERPSPGSFGVVLVKTPGQAGPGFLTLPGTFTEESVVFLWVVSSGADAAIEAMKARGFRYAPAAT